MHELSVAAALYEWALARSRAYAPRRIQSIEVELDRFSCLNEEALSFSFEALTSDTELAGARLNFVCAEPSFECRECGESGRSLDSPLRCRACGAPRPRLARDSSLRVRSIEVES